MKSKSCTCASFFTVRGVHKKDCPKVKSTLKQMKHEAIIEEAIASAELPKEKETFSVNIKGFWGQLFCIHDYEKIGTQTMYNNIAEKDAGMPCQEYIRAICKKCSKVTKIQII